MKTRIMLCALVMAFAAMPAVAMDLDAVKAHEFPNPDSAQEAEVCTAVLLAFTFAAEDQESEAAKTDSFLGRMWMGIAADKTGTTYNAYLDSTAMSDMQSLAGTDGDTLDLYHTYCQTASKRVIDAAHQAKSGGGAQ